MSIPENDPKSRNLFQHLSGIFLSLLFIFPAFYLWSQTAPPASDLPLVDKSPFPKLEIIAETVPDEVKKGSRLTLKIWGRIGNGFHIYSIAPQGEFGPEPTILFIDSPFLQAVSRLHESDPVIIHDRAFGMSLKVHKNDFSLQQDFLLSAAITSGRHTIRGNVLYQICDKKICSFPISRSFISVIHVID